MSKHTGAAEVYDPETESAVAERVKSLLADGLHVDEAVQVALLNNRSFQSQFLEIGVSRADLVQSGLLTNPSLSVLPRIPDIGGRINLTLDFAQEIADLWQIPVRKKMARAQLENTIVKVADTAVSLAAQVKTAYYQIATLEESLRLGKENAALLEKAMTLAQHRFDAGETTLLDVNLVKSDALAEQMRLAGLERDLKQARTSFEELLGIGGLGVVWHQADGIEVPKADLPDDTTLIQTAMAQRLDMQIAAGEVRVAEQELVKQARSVFPSLTVGAEMERPDHKAGPNRFERGIAAWHPLTEKTPTFPTRREDQLDAQQVVNYLTGPSFQMTLPVWDQNRAQIEKARIKVLQKRKDREALEESVRTDVAKAWIGAMEAAGMVRGYDGEALPLAEKNNATARRVYESGEDSILVVMEAQKTLIAVREARNQALGDYAAALVELERAVGGRISPAASEATPNSGGDVK